MACVVECVIIGCCSNREKNIKFFQFPPHDSSLYETWMHKCHRSAKAIRKERKPFICEKHFARKDITFLGLAPNSVPAFYLNPSFNLSYEGIDLMAAQEKRIRMLNFINAVVLEWYLRAPKLDAELESGTLKAIATKVHNMVDPTLSLTFDNCWFKRFSSHHLRKRPFSKKWNKDLNLAKIIKYVDPSLTVSAEDEIDDFEEIRKLSWSEKSLKAGRNNVINTVQYSGKQYGSKVPRTQSKDDLDKQSNICGCNLENNTKCMEHDFQEQPELRKNTKSYGKCKDDINISNESIKNLSTSKPKIALKKNCGKVDIVAAEVDHIGSQRMSNVLKFENEVSENDCSQSENNLNEEIINDQINLINTDDQSLDSNTDLEYFGEDIESNLITTHDESLVSNTELEFFELDVTSELTITSYKDALEHLKVLEDYVVKQDDNRAVQILSTLKNVLQKRAASE